MGLTPGPLGGYHSESVPAPELAASIAEPLPNPHTPHEDPTAPADPSALPVTGATAALGHSGPGEVPQPDPQLHPGLHSGRGGVRHHK